MSYEFQTDTDFDSNFTIPGGKGENVYTATKGTKNTMTKSNHDGEDDHEDPPKVSLTGANYPFPIRFTAKRSYGKNDPNNHAATDYLFYQFNPKSEWSNKDLQESINADNNAKYNSENGNRFWQTPFSAKDVNTQFTISETCAGYLYRLLGSRYEEASTNHRDLMVQILHEYKNDNVHFNEYENLNRFLIKVDQITKNLTLEHLMARFNKMESGQFEEIINKEEVIGNYQSELDELRGKIVWGNNQNDSKEDNNSEPNSPPDQEYDEYLEGTISKDERIYDIENGYLSQAQSEHENLKKNQYYEKIISTVVDQELDQLETKELSSLEYFKLKMYLSGALRRRVMVKYLNQSYEALSAANYNQILDNALTNVKKSKGGKTMEDLLSYYQQIHKVFKLEANNQSENSILKQWKSYQEKKFVINSEWSKNRKRYGTMMEISGKLFLKIITSKKNIDYTFVVNYLEENSYFHRVAHNQESDMEDFGISNPDGIINVSIESKWLEDHVQKIKPILNLQSKVQPITQERLFPIKAIVIPDKLSASEAKSTPVPLQLYLRKQGDTKWGLYDYTNPLSPTSIIEDQGSTRKTVRFLFNKFSKDVNIYPKGKLVIQQFDRSVFGDKWTNQVFGKEEYLSYEYDGKTDSEGWIEWLRTVSSTLTNVGMALRFVPIPLVQGLSGALIVTGQLTGAAAGGMDISKRVNNGTFQWDFETAQNVVEIVGGASPLGSKLKDGSYAKIAFNVIDQTNNYAGFTMLPAEVIKELQRIDDDETITDKSAAKSTYIWSKAKETGTMFIADKAGLAVQKKVQTKQAHKEKYGNATNAGPNGAKLFSPEVQKAKLNEGLAKIDKGVLVVDEKFDSKNPAHNNVIKEEHGHLFVHAVKIVDPPTYSEAITVVTQSKEFDKFYEESLTNGYYKVAQEQVGNSETAIKQYLAEELLGKKIGANNLSFTPNDNLDTKTSFLSKFNQRMDDMVSYFVNGKNSQDAAVERVKQLIEKGHRQTTGMEHITLPNGPQTLKDLFEATKKVDHVQVGNKVYNNVQTGRPINAVFYHLDKNNKLENLIKTLDPNQEKLYNKWVAEMHENTSEIIMRYPKNINGGKVYTFTRVSRESNLWYISINGKRINRENGNNEMFYDRALKKEFAYFITLHNKELEFHKYQTQSAEQIWLEQNKHLKDKPFYQAILNRHTARDKFTEEELDGRSLHHINPVSLLRDDKIKVLRNVINNRQGKVFNDRPNGIPLVDFNESTNVGTHNGNHPKYTENMRKVYMGYDDINSGRNSSATDIEFVDEITSIMKNVINFYSHDEKGIKLDDLFNNDQVMVNAAGVPVKPTNTNSKDLIKLTPDNLINIALANISNNE